MIDFSDASLDQSLPDSLPIHDTAEINRILIATLETWLPRLLPGVKQFTQDFRAGSIRGEPGSSLSIQRTGPRRGLWQDRATGETGDPIALIQASLNADFKTALESAARIAELPMRPTPTAQIASRSPAENIAAAQRIIDASLPIEGTIAFNYLREHRGLRFAAQPDLRFHPGLYHWPTRKNYPALIGVVRDAATHTIRGVHRTFLDPATGNKIDHDNPRLALGPVSGGAVRLWSPSTPVTTPAGTAVVCEGIETGLAFLQLYPSAPVVYATLSTSGLRNFIAPPNLTRLLIAADFDPVNPTTQRRPGTQAAEHLQQRYSATIDTAIMYPDRPFKDFNDALKQ